MLAFGAMPWGQTKPPVGVVIDLSSQFANGMFVCALFNEGGVPSNIANGAVNRGTFSSTVPVWRPHKGGQGLYFDNTLTTYVDIPGTIGDTGTGGKLSYVVGLTQLSTAGVTPRIFANADSDNTAPNLQLLNSTTWQYTPKSSNIGGTVTIPIGAAVGTYQQHVITIDGAITDLNGGRIKWYVNGVSQTVTVTANGDGRPVDTNTRVGGILAAARSADCVIHHFYKYNRLIAPAEAKELYTNPYAMVVAPRRRIISGAAAASTTIVQLERKIRGLNRGLTRGMN